VYQNSNSFAIAVLTGNLTPCETLSDRLVQARPPSCRGDSNGTCYFSGRSTFVTEAGDDLQFTKDWGRRNRATSRAQNGCVSQTSQGAYYTIVSAQKLVHRRWYDAQHARRCSDQLELKEVV
jgi:hypothetical protein